MASHSFAEPQLLDGLLSHIADQIAVYVQYQIDSGADCIMMFDSWGGQLPPKQWDRWSRPYIERIVRQVKASHPRTPLTLYANGSGGMLERMAGTGADVIGLDWTVDMADARRRLGADVSVQVSSHSGGAASASSLKWGAQLTALRLLQCGLTTCRRPHPSPPRLQGNVDPVVLFGSQAAIEDAVRDCLAKAGERGHVLNLGHGVLVGTPEDNVAFMFDLSKKLKYSSLEPAAV
jgi:uroporphyrinogen decarboxylase